MPSALMFLLKSNSLGDHFSLKLLGGMLGLVVAVGLPLLMPLSPAIAQSTPYLPPPPKPEPREPAANPLDTSLFPGDPLLPSSQALTPLQRRRLQEGLDALELEAQALDQAGQTDEAFGVWYRSLRGRQRLGELAEIEALGRIGNIAWEKNRKVDVAIISKRLETLQTTLTAKKSMTPELLTAFAQAYRQLHSLDAAIAVYQTMRREAQQQKDYRRENQVLSMLGELYLAKFNYPAAAEIYELLLDRAVASKNTYYEGLYLQKLGDIYQQASQPDNAIRIKERLVRRHLQDRQILLIPEIKIAIAEDYLALDEAEKASQTYQEAYTLAWSIQQLSTAAIALDKLGDLYRSREQPNYALEIYKRLLQVQQQSYNYYGMMSTYEKIAQLYINAQQPGAALTAYQQALSLARSLKYSTKENALLNQIQALSTGSGT
jgi:tetratricopeptide (TPR) repeat protein